MNDLTELLDIIKARAAGPDRFLVAIAGPPGSGKSTLAADLARLLGPTATVLPMDGFHLDNDRLRNMGLLDRKGAPETFDAQGFVDLLRTVRDAPHVSYPTFDRQSDCAIPDAGAVVPANRIIVVEGNYLLLNTSPWSELADIFDLTVSLEVDRDELERRLVARWLGHGLSIGQARLRARGNDMRNADHLARNSREPDFVLRNGD